MANDPFESLLLKAYPNPGRVGCPGTEKLRGLVEDPQPIDDPLPLHVRNCSPCFEEFRTFRDAKRAGERRRSMMGVSAGMLAMCAGLALVMYWPQLKTGGHANSSPTVEVAQLDFSGETAERGSDSTVVTTPKVNSATRVLILSLPAGSDAGDYDVEIRSAANIATTVKSLPKATLKLPAERPSLQCNLSSPGLSPGSYVAAWRLHGSELWHYGSFVVS